MDAASNEKGKNHSDKQVHNKTGVKSLYITFFFSLEFRQLGKAKWTNMVWSDFFLKTLDASWLWLEAALASHCITAEHISDRAAWDRVPLCVL